MRLSAIVLCAAALMLDPPAAPTGLGVTPGGGQNFLNWADNSPAVAGYNVYRAPTSVGPWTQANMGLLTPSEYLDEGRTNGTPYFYVVRAVNATQEESAASSVVMGVPTGTDSTAPPTPQITSASRKTCDTTPVTSGTGEPGATIRLFIGSTEIATTTVAGNGTWSVSPAASLGTDAQYVIQARAEDAVPNLSAMSSITVTLDTTPPDVPTNVRVMATPGFIDVEWSPSVAADLAGYKVFRQTNGGSWTLLNTTGLVLIAKYRDSNVAAGNDYKYRVTAVDDALEN